MVKIFLAPIQFSNKQLLKNIIQKLQEVFPGNVEIIELPIDVESFRSVDRNQYYSTKILAQAIRHTDEYYGKVLILVDFDLYVPVFTFLYGEAQLNGKHSIVSLCRLHEEFYSGITNDELLLNRAMKEIYHELGHNFGLIHCKDWNCVMHQSAIIEEVDIKGGFYCGECLEKVKDVLY